jgi:protein-disulfide isomerase
MLATPVSAQDHVQGSRNASVTLVEYGDYQCPYCADAEPALAQLRERFGDDLRFVYRNFPLGELHPYAWAAADLAEAAAGEGRFWEMHDWLYAEQDAWVPLGPEGLAEGASAVGLDAFALAEAVQDPAIGQRVEADIESGRRSGVRGTPSFYVNGEAVDGGVDALAERIASALRH